MHQLKITSAPDKRRKHILFNTWSDTEPELIGVYEGTEAECKAWCTGFTYGTATRTLSTGGEAVTLEKRMGDPNGHGLSGELPREASAVA